MKSPIAYIGGKSKLAAQITSHFPTHKSYIEVFTGAGWVFFTKDQSKFEIINDKDGDLISFYRVVQNHLEEFFKQFRYLLPSRETFKDFEAQLKAGGLTDIQKAARYYYNQRLCFGGKVAGRTFGTSPERPPRINLLRMEEELSAVHLRLIQVMIENLSWKECIQKYDRPDSLFYLDPPYYKKPVYKYNFIHSDFVELSDVLKAVNGRFFLSLNDCDEVREIFKDFNIYPVSLNYTVGRKGQTKAQEVFITNYKLRIKNSA